MHRANTGPTLAAVPGREAVLRLQQGVQRDLQARVRSFTGATPSALERYQRNYLRELSRYQSVSSYGELFAEMLQRDIVYIGDYHTLRQSQEVALHLLERAAADPRPVILALEMVHSEHQAPLDAYARGALDETQFRAAVQYNHTWNFNWNNYRPLFELARAQRVRLVGINQTIAPGRGRIQARDARIAEQLAGVLAAQPEARLVVLIGDLHLASSHLPRAVDALLTARGLQRSRLVVHQNSDALYWDLVRRGDERETRVVRLGDGLYCVMEVPPFVKLESYLSWEQTLDDADLDLLVEPILLQTCVNRLADFVRLPRFVVHCEVFTNLDEAFFQALERSRSVSRTQVREAHLLAFANRGCYVPAIDAVYLPYFSVNHTTEQAMHVLCSKYGAEVRSEDPVEDFYRRTLRVAVGFLASKLVNPHRRATSELELRGFLRQAARRLREPQLAFRKRVARLVIQHKDYETARRGRRLGHLQQVYEEDLDVRLEVTSTLGYQLGEGLAEALYTGSWQPEELRELIEHLANDAASRYFELADACASS